MTRVLRAAFALSLVPALVVGAVAAEYSLYRCPMMGGELHQDACCPDAGARGEGGPSVERQCCDEVRVELAAVPAQVASKAPVVAPPAATVVLAAVTLPVALSVPESGRPLAGRGPPARVLYQSFLL